jgi:hypothetical protein
MYQMLAQCNLDTFISKITEFKDAKQVVFWDQFSYCKTSKPYIITKHDDEIIMLFGGFHDGGCDLYRDFYFDEDDKITYVGPDDEYVDYVNYDEFDKKPLISMTHDEFKNLLASERKIHGNINVVLWEQAQYVKFDNLSDLFEQKNDILYVGGFHHNADVFKDIPENVHFEELVY